MPDNSFQLKRRKEIIESRLAAYGIHDYKISHLRYLDFSAEEFQTTYDVGCRILILWTTALLSVRQDAKEKVREWLKAELLWGKVSEKEQEIFDQDLSEQDLENFYWNIEAAIVLCWTVSLVSTLPTLDKEFTDDDLQGLAAKLPIYKNTEVFLNSLQFINKEDILIENIINEMITGYFRDRWLSGKKEKLKINPSISFERHKALNWLRQFSGISDWDDTDTST
jgi:hypothetical protein